MRKLLIIILTILMMTGCGQKTDEVKAPKTASDLKNQNYKDVVTLFKEAGFENIEVEAVEDLILGWLTKENSVESVSVGGDTDYSTSKKYSKDTKVRITYHTFPSDNENELSNNGVNAENTVLVTMGEYEIKVPTYWENSDPYYYAEKGEGISMFYYMVGDTITLDSFDQLYSVSEYVLNGMGNQIDDFASEEPVIKRINNIDTVKLRYSGLLNEKQMDVYAYLLFQPKAKNMLTIVFAQSKEALLNGVRDFESAMETIELASSNQTNNNIHNDNPSVTEENESVTSETGLNNKNEEKLSYYSGTKDTVKNGNKGIYSYKSVGGSYDIYWIIDFDDGYVYNFFEGNDDEACDKVKIKSGSLNDAVTVSYNNSDYAWLKAMHFKWLNQPDHLVVIDDDGFDYDYYTTDLDKALSIRNNKNIYER